MEMAENLLFIEWTDEEKKKPNSKPIENWKPDKTMTNKSGSIYYTPHNSI